MWSAKVLDCDKYFISVLQIKKLGYRDFKTHSITEPGTGRPGFWPRTV